MSPFRYGMMTLEDALLKIQEVVNSNVKKCELININHLHGRITFNVINSQCDLPAFKVSTKHGYAVLASDGECERIVLHRTTSAPVSLTPGTCTYVKSGERVPEGNNSHSVQININPEFGQNIKNIGSDISKEKQILPQFTRIGPAELGILAAMGCKAVPVVKHVSVGIFSIGEFLVEPGEPLNPGQVYDSARISLIALLKHNDFNSIMDFGIVKDDTQSIKMKIENVLKQVDVLVTIGCSNDNDLLKPILRNKFRATIHFGNVLLKPGKSTIFATYKVNKKLKKYIVCLPKNPMSALVSTHLFLLPILEGLSCIYRNPCTFQVRVEKKYFLHPRPRAAWAILKWNDMDVYAQAVSRENLIGDQIFSCQGANALLLFPQQTKDQKESYTLYATAYLINN
ncbi:gephyrin-like isoform X2 [Camponotus floridanus]|uniref:gephyrin-like isoform X2 n=1 Tax=Camponotus floridanus TaxID=104421 RepID=UPI000DC669BB|nr:gephyrin-like isoform X2 [Camponotus floridanus]